MSNKSKNIEKSCDQVKQNSTPGNSTLRDFQKCD